jgi:nucleotide-binding universal stress UspA family protein
MKRVLAAVDFSDVTERVIQRALEMVRAFAGSLCIVHAEPPEPAFMGYEAGPQTVRDDVAHEIQRDRRELDALCDRVRAEGVEVHGVQLQGPTVDKILLEAQRFQAEVIVIGTHEHGLFHHLIFGSVRESLVAQAPCPILVVPPPAKAKSEE